MDKLKNQLAGVAALIGVVGAIGAGFVTYGQMQEKIANLEGLNLEPIIKEIANQNVKLATLEEKISKLEGTDLTDHDHEHGHTKILVNEKTIQLLQNQLDEIKELSGNPLAQ